MAKTSLATLEIVLPVAMATKQSVAVAAKARGLVAVICWSAPEAPIFQTL
ncbi:MAG: hypothetical protein HZC10_02805 [Nitrospirae bacterium]|nr:hypothetical protein [Nitrospirota bacterium]